MLWLLLAAVAVLCWSTNLQSTLKATVFLAVLYETSGHRIFDVYIQEKYEI